MNVLLLQTRFTDKKLEKENIRPAYKTQAKQTKGMIP